MSFLFGNKNKQEIVAVIDIGSGRVGGALVAISGNEKPKILFTTQKTIAADHDLDIGKFAGAMQKSLQYAVADLTGAKLGKVNRIVCFLSSPWYVSQTRDIRYSKNTPFVFNQKLLDELVTKEIKLFEGDHLQKYTGRGEPRIIESKITQILLHGYKTDDPFGKKVKEIDISAYISISPAPIIDLIERELFRAFHLSKVHFATFLFSSYAVARDLFPDKEDFILIDVGSELTDIAIVKSDMLTESLSFPRGENFLLRKIAEGLGKSVTESSSLLNMCLDDKLGSPDQEKVSKHLQSAKRDWLSMFQKTLGEMASDLLVPENIFLITDKPLASCFIEAINKEEFSQYALSEKKFEITALNEPLLHNFCTFEAKAARDRFLILESIFISTKMRS